MKKISISLLLSFCIASFSGNVLSASMESGNKSSSSSVTNKETIVLFRHAEKPILGLGQLSCQGQNRALALPKVLVAKFGQPTALFAPNPSVQKADLGVLYDYIRPLATIEPTAIKAGLPVDTSFGFNDAEVLTATLTSKKYANATLFVAWEHKWIDTIAKTLLTENNGLPSKVPFWESDDFDSLYVITLQTDDAGKKSAIFVRDREDLNGQSIDCPY